MNKQEYIVAALKIEIARIQAEVRKESAAGNNDKVDSLIQEYKQLQQKLWRV